MFSAVRVPFTFVDWNTPTTTTVTACHHHSTPVSNGFRSGSSTTFALSSSRRYVARQEEHAVVLVDLAKRGSQPGPPSPPSGSRGGDLNFETERDDIRVLLQPHRRLTATCVLDHSSGTSVEDRNLNNNNNNNNNVLIASGDDGGLVHVFDLSTPFRSVDTPYASPLLANTDMDFGSRWRRGQPSNHSVCHRYPPHRSFSDLTTHHHSPRQDGEDDSISSASRSAEMLPARSPTTCFRAAADDVDDDGIKGVVDDDNNDHDHVHNQYSPHRVFFSASHQLPTYRVVSSFYLRADDEPFFSVQKTNPTAVTSIVDPYDVSATGLPHGGMLLCQRQPQPVVALASPAATTIIPMTGAYLPTGLKHNRMGYATSPSSHFFTVRESTENVGLWMASMVKDMVWQVPLRRHPSDVTAQVRLTSIRHGTANAAHIYGSSPIAMMVKEEYRSGGFATITASAPGLDTACTLHHPTTMEPIAHFQLPIIGGASVPIVAEPASSLVLQQRTIQSVVSGSSNEVWISAASMFTGSVVSSSSLRRESVVFIFDIRKPSEPIQVKNLWTCSGAANERLHYSSGSTTSCSCSCGSTEWRRANSHFTDPGLSLSSSSWHPSGSHRSQSRNMEGSNNEFGAAVVRVVLREKQRERQPPQRPPQQTLLMEVREAVTQSEEGEDGNQVENAGHNTGCGGGGSGVISSHASMGMEVMEEPYASPRFHASEDQESPCSPTTSSSVPQQEEVGGIDIGIDIGITNPLLLQNAEPSLLLSPCRRQPDPTTTSSPRRHDNGKTNPSAHEIQQRHPLLLPCVMTEYLEDHCYAVISVPPTPAPPRVTATTRSAASPVVASPISREESREVLDAVVNGKCCGTVVDELPPSPQLSFSLFAPTLHTFRCAATLQPSTSQQPSSLSMSTPAAADTTVLASAESTFSSIVQHHVFPLPHYSSSTVMINININNNNNKSKRSACHEHVEDAQMERKQYTPTGSPNRQDTTTVEEDDCCSMKDFHAPQHQVEHSSMQHELVYYNGILHILRG